MTTQFRSSGGSRQLLYPAPIHAGHQPANEPALHRHTDGSCGERESGPAGSEGFGSGHADGGQGVTHLITDGWIPAHEVYSDEQDEMPRRLHDSDLRFESRFESGNLASAVRAGAGPEYNLYLRPDKGTGGCQWYYFMVSNMRRGLRYKLNIMHFYKEKSLYHHGQRPLFWSQKHSQSDESVGWRRAGDEIRYFENGIRKKNGGRNFTLSFLIDFPFDNDVCFIAMCYPFTYSDLRTLLLETEMLTLKSRILTRSELCKSEAGHSCEMLTIRSPLKPSRVEKRPVFFISGRVHPGESNASYIVKGAIQFLVSDDEIAKALRENFVFEIIPMLNPDGVIHGHYRVSKSGDDLNRNWTNPCEERHPTIFYAKKRLRSLAADGRLLFFCDVHGHSTKRNVFMYGCNSVAFGSTLFATQEAQRGGRRELQFPKLFSERCPVLSFKDCLFAVDKTKENTGRAAVARECAIIHSYTLEASFCGSDLHDGSLVHFSTADLQDVGVQLCKTVAAYTASHDHGWELLEGVSAEMETAMLTDGPPPGSSILDLYYESLKEIEDKKAQQPKSTLADAVAQIMGASKMLTKAASAETTQSDNWHIETGEDGTPDAFKISPSIRTRESARLGRSTSLSPARVPSDASTANGHSIPASWRSSSRSPVNRSIASRRFALGKDSRSSSPQSLPLTRVPSDPHNDGRSNQHFSKFERVQMTESERRQREEADPGIKYVRVSTIKKRDVTKHDCSSSFCGPETRTDIIPAHRILIPAGKQKLSRNRAGWSPRASDRLQEQDNPTLQISARGEQCVDQNAVTMVGVTVGESRNVKVAPKKPTSKWRLGQSSYLMTQTQLGREEATCAQEGVTGVPEQLPPVSRRYESGIADERYGGPRLTGAVRNDNTESPVGDGLSSDEGHDRDELRFKGRRGRGGRQMIAPRTSQFQIDSVRPQETLLERLHGVMARGNRAVELSSAMAAQATSNDIMITKPGTGPRSALSNALARKTRTGILPPRLEAARMHEQSPALASPKTRT